MGVGGVGAAEVGAGVVGALLAGVEVVWGVAVAAVEQT